MVVLGYERYGSWGGNRVSLTISILAVGSNLAVTAISAGGSRAMFFPVVRLSEATFLGRAVSALRSFPQP